MIFTTSSVLNTTKLLLGAEGTRVFAPFQSQTSLNSGRLKGGHKGRRPGTQSSVEGQGNPLLRSPILFYHQTHGLVFLNPANLVLRDGVRTVALL